MDLCCVLRAKPTLTINIFSRQKIYKMTGFIIYGFIDYSMHFLQLNKIQGNFMQIVFLLVKKKKTDCQELSISKKESHSLSFEEIMFFMRFVWNTLHPILSGQIGWPPSMTTSEKCACICKKYVARKGHTCTNGVILPRFFFSAIDLLLHAIDFG